jgi:hypothetical protein
MKVLIFGSSNIKKMHYVEIAISESPVQNEITELIISDDKGIAELVNQYGQKHNIPVTQFNTETDKYGNQAIPKRNLKMIKYMDYSIAIWNGIDEETKLLMDKLKDKCFKTRT